MLDTTQNSPNKNTPDMMRVFDRVLHARNRARAAANFTAYDFLLRRVAEDMEDRLEIIMRDFPLALDLGAHHGFLSLMTRNPTKLGQIITTDLSPAMLDHAKGARVVLDEERLPFADKSFNLIASALSLHWVNDLPGALIQIRRALVPDGLFMGALFGGETLIELRQALAEAEVECDGGLSPHVSPFADLRDMGGLLQRAGFTLPVVDSDKVTVNYGDVTKLMRDLRGMGEANALIERRRTPMKRATLRRAAEIYKEKFGLADGRVPATFEIIMLAGWSRHESQQKPLRPGSAKARLADALGTKEIKAPR